MSDIKSHNNYTIQFYAYLAWQRNQDIVKKTEAYREAMNWKDQKYTGRADVCFEIYGEMKDKLTKSLPYFKQVGKAVNAKPVLGNDMMVVAIEQKTQTGWTTVAKDMKEIQSMGEDWVMESVILGSDNG